MKIIIIGAGDVGFHLARRLSGEHDVTLVDQDPQVVKKAASALDAIVIEGDASSLQLLKQARIQDADICAAMTHNDPLNILTCMMAKHTGKATTIARLTNPEYMEPDFAISRADLGVDFMIHPEVEAARVIHQLLRQSVPSNAVPIADGRLQFTGMRVELTSPFHNRTVKDVVAGMAGVPFRMVAVRRKERSLIPHGSTILKSGDMVYFICAPEHLKDLVKATGHTQAAVRNVMILGGGSIAQYLATAPDRSYEVKIIESNLERTHRMAERLSDSALVIHGDGTDIDLLVQEGITSMDAFIALTGSDETNIISNLVAKHLQVPRTMALLNNPEYLPITSTIGLDAVISKELLAVNAVQRFIRNRSGSTVTSLPGLDVEIVEYTAAERCKASRKALADIDFPSNALVAAVTRGSTTSVTDGKTVIEAGDRVVVVSLPDYRREVEKWFR